MEEHDTTTISGLGKTTSECWRIVENEILDIEQREEMMYMNKAQDQEGQEIRERKEKKMEDEKEQLEQNLEKKVEHEMDLANNVLSATDIEWEPTHYDLEK